MDGIKVDRSFVQRIQSNRRDLLIVQHLLNVARDLNLRSIVEGIESIGQALLLTRLGADWGQGYYFAKPMPLSECVSYIEDHAELRMTVGD